MASLSNGDRAFTCASTALSMHTRVKLDASGNLVSAGDEAGIGFLNRNVDAGGVVSVRMHNQPGTFLAIAGAAITKGAAVGGVSGGKVSASATNKFYTALQAASGDGSIIEIMPIQGA